MAKSHDHKMESGFQKIPISICMEEGCEFRGQRATQGNCYSQLPRAHDKYVNYVLKSGEQLVKELRGLRKVNKQTSKDAWIKALEGQVVCLWANDTFHLDQIVHLRAENARLRNALGKKEKFERGDFSKDRISLKRKPKK
jgi:hypothetical protein